MSEKLTPERLSLLGRIDREDERRARRNPPKPLYIRRDDKLGHVWHTPSRRTRIDWTPVICVIVFAFLIYAVLVIIGIL